MWKNLPIQNLSQKSTLCRFTQKVLMGLWLLALRQRSYQVWQEPK
jgi:hypothetical protein